MSAPDRRASLIAITAGRRSAGNACCSGVGRSGVYRRLPAEDDNELMRCTPLGGFSARGG